MEYAILFCQNVWKQPWVQIHIHVVYFFPVLVEVLKCHQVSGLWVKLNVLLSSFCSFLFFISFFHCLMQRCWAANFLKEEYSCSIVDFPISLHNRFSALLGWHQLQEYVTHFFFSCFVFFKPCAFSGVFKLARLWNYKNEKDWEFWAALNILFMAYALWKSCTIRFQTVLKYI